jgi:hypothetical protein
MSNEDKDTDLLSKKIFNLVGKTSYREEILHNYQVTYQDDPQYLEAESQMMTRLLGCVPGDQYMLIGTFGIHKQNKISGGRSSCSKEINAAGIVDAKIALDRLNELNEMINNILSDPRWKYK